METVETVDSGSDGDNMVDGTESKFDFNKEELARKAQDFSEKVMNSAAEAGAYKKVAFAGKSFYITDLIGAGSLVVTFISLFLPYITSAWLSLSYIQGDGKITLVLIIAALATVFFKKRLTAAILSILMIAMPIYSLIQIRDFAWGEYVSMGIGFYLYILSAIVATVCFGIGFMQSKKERQF